VGWQARTRPEVLLLVWWAAALYLATLLQWRFMNSYSIAHCLLIGIVGTSLWQKLAQGPSSPTRRMGAAVVALAIVCVAFYRPVNSYRLSFANLGRSFRGEETTPVGNLLQTRFVADAARFLRENSPSNEPADYSVLGPWGDGHILKYFGERAIVQDNFGDDVGPENFARGEAYFDALSEANALETLSPVGTRYVLVRSVGSGHSHGYSPKSVFSSLYQLKGSRGQPPHLKGLYSAPVAALAKHRLIYQSESISPSDPKPYCMLFEIVTGAELQGRTTPGAKVRVKLEVKPLRGRAFTYFAQAVADEAGRYTMRLPYSNEAFSPDIRTGDHYRVSVGDEVVDVVVPERAVLDGMTLLAPPIGL
jgi:asparagine N-glycosylation enzyme membrane subunit Stt3